MPCYAHSPGPRGWHDLYSHLTEVARMACQFAAPFGAGELAYWIGFCHDLGKINPAFQQYLETVNCGQPHPVVPHAIWGGALAYWLLWKHKQDAYMWKLLALPIYGHHAGLPNGGTISSVLEHFVQETPVALDQMMAYLQEHKALLPRLRAPALTGTRLELFIRMVYSALVDADYLDTEGHFNPAEASKRGGWPRLEELLEQFKRNQQEFMARVPDTLVNRVRREVYEACWHAAERPPGIFRLTVPTGGGKTRSGLAFALRHAVIHGLRRVVVAIPYTSIIDQTATEYRKILGNAAVVEHHSQLQPPEDESQSELALRQRLATENWDAPLIVTTTVQLFESLFSARPHQARKLHNLARSVILLDEVQSLPPEILAPTVDVLRSLVENYGVTVVLCTATQPALDRVPALSDFQEVGISEIVTDYPRHFTLLRRVQYERRAEPMTWAELAREVANRSQIMVVLNRRRDALALLEVLKEDPDVFHLSTLLCGAHRREVLNEVKQRLKDGKRVRLISTQVVEAGVDLDFPEVWRAVGPLDRIVQAAGRCNREGARHFGRLVIFEPAEGGSPSGPYKVGIEKARQILEHYPPDALHSPDIFREYFAELYSTVNLDAKNIQQLREDLNYPEVASRYRLIAEDTVPVVVDYKDGFRRLDDWLRRPTLEAWRALQPYVVSIYRREVHQNTEWLEPVFGGLYRWSGGYDPKRGLVQSFHDPSDLIA
ncbi:MAG: CRISPR-associated helicase/endonuclease Cas3 [Symbiobacterium thermophilum]|uniref:CRISPR-associated helicase/endonuclease Cas3 n=1 Tax=Symbiobacterium thermophilum TaxID=2734 RepID=A0A953IAH1_SYMTR|nr:CRISPR-associated helicase/endonuclease Cas3 [Symbiobacterium thermophilum]